MRPKEITHLLERHSRGAHKRAVRARRYRGDQPVRFASTELPGDLKSFNVNICKLAVDAIAERMRVSGIEGTARGRDLTTSINDIWYRSDMDQCLESVLVEALALGTSYLSVWNDHTGKTVIRPESSRHMVHVAHPVTGEVLAALKVLRDPDTPGAEHVLAYEPGAVTTYLRRGGKLTKVDELHNPLGVVPVVPLVNSSMIGGEPVSVTDDLAHLVDALSKTLADMLTASEDVARPRRWATGVDLKEEEDDEDGFTADGPSERAAAPAPAVSPFEQGNRMFTVEAPDAKFGQLPGADLAGYRTAVDIIVQQIMAVSALPAHMVGVTSSNPASADAIRAAEASLTARAQSRISTLGRGVETALRLAGSIVANVPLDEVQVSVTWASPATRSIAQESDAVTKLYSLGILTRDEARERLGVGQ